MNSLPENIGPQIGAISFDSDGPRGSFASAYIAESKRDGKIVVLRGHFASIHDPVVKPAKV